MKKNSNKKKVVRKRVTRTKSLFVITDPPPTLSELKELIMDKQDVMQLLHISSGTLLNWRSEGILPYIKLGGKIYYYKPDILKLLERYLVC